MLFNSYIFVLLFFPICVLGFFLINYFQKYNLSYFFLIVMSLLFYGYTNINYLWLIILSIVVNYVFYLLIISKTIGKKKFFILFGITFNVFVLLYFKYFDFFVENFNLFFDADYSQKNIILPLGISFFTFQQISFLVDAYKGTVPKYSFLHYSLFVLFFPQLVAGPIVEHNELLPQLLERDNKKVNWNNISKGIYIFVIGMSKKVLVADVVGNIANWGFSNISILDTTNAVMTMFCYTIQIYFDFSGYSDMAVGIAKVFNIDLPFNFNSPYKAMNIAEFWNKWHITLTRFLTKYVYIPLGGNQKGSVKTYINILIVFFISGMWHGANWTFIVWGILHGLGMVIWRVTKRWLKKIPSVISWLGTFVFINITWVIFRVETLGQAFEFFKKIFSFQFGGLRIEVLSRFKGPTIKLVQRYITCLTEKEEIILILFLLIVMCGVVCSKNSYERMNEYTPKISTAVGMAFLLVCCIFSFASVSTFLYFNF